jgi:hypothetical protein
MVNFSKDSLCSSLDSNWTPLEFSFKLLVEPACLITLLLFSVRKIVSPRRAHIEPEFSFINNRLVSVVIKYQ